ncbi:hypothetical protein C6P45_003643 [Maudiozyma exigua]|uniref:Uncharacterized protein n=1 Tax=Maudiozyma exigua TaxID=34358 RepID=A0A9P6VSQ0_MAUEX|nr:hypothetical protein C6P45_003643 [Kazachstania exigua]
MTMDSKEKKQYNISTKTIRNELNFDDDETWKQFSTRRYQLIETFKLGQEKASDQNDNISQVAHILRTEFHYPLSRSGYFEKLVIAGIQCTRRNKQRSLKRQNGKVSKGNKESNSKAFRSATNHKVAQKIIKREHAVDTPRLPQNALRFANDSVGQQRKRDGYKELILGGTEPTGYEPLENSNQNKKNTLEYDPQYDSIIRSVLLDVIHKDVPMSEQKKRSSHIEPDLSKFLTNCEPDMESLISMQPKSEIPFSLKEKLLRSIEISKTCSELAKSHNALNDYKSLYSLGKSVYDTAVNFVVEKFKVYQIEKLDFVNEKGSEEKFISDLSLQLFSSATKHDISSGLSNRSSGMLFILTVGSLIKDFGFDPVLYPLSELVMQHIMINYPFQESKSRQASPINDMSHDNHTVLMTLPIDPKKASQEVYKTVIIKYGTKEQNFRFPLLSNGPPTVMEIVQNCRTLFNISNLNRSSFGLFNKGQLITDDEHLSSLFARVREGELTLVIKPMESISIVK